MLSNPARDLIRSLTLKEIFTRAKTVDFLGASFGFIGCAARRRCCAFCGSTGSFPIDLGNWKG